MSALAGQTVEDVRTAITSLAAAVAGSASEALGQMLSNAAGLDNRGGVGNVGMSFVLRAAVSSVLFGATASLLPDTAGNILFSFVFFASNPSLISDARYIGNAVVRGIMHKVPPVHLPPPREPGNGPQPAMGCAGGCN